MTSSVRSTVRAFFQTAVDQVKREGVLPAAPESIPIERPRRPEHGDYATNVALALAKDAGRQPRVLAEIIVKYLLAEGGADISEVSVAGPGFINLRLSDAFWQRRLLDILAAGDRWGAGEPEAVTARAGRIPVHQPDGPLHFAHGRHAAVGDSLTRLLRFAGYDVLREYYINDAGNQVAMLALSVWARYMEAAKGEDWTGVIVPEVAFPENGYRGDYIRKLGRELLEREAGRLSAPTLRLTWSRSSSSPSAAAWT